MIGWLLIITGIFAYIGIATLYYIVLVKWCNAGADELTAAVAFCWPVMIPIMLLLLPFIIFQKFAEWIGERIDK